MDRTTAASFLRQNGWLSHLEPSLQDAWLEGANFLKVSKTERIFEVHDAPRLMFGIAEGSVAAYLSVHPEQARMSILYGAGSWAGDASVVSGNPHRGTAVAHTDCEILIVPSTHIETLAARFPDIWRTISLNVLIQFDVFIALTEAVLSKDPCVRVLTLFQCLRKLDFKKQWFDLSVEEIGQMIGLSRNTVSKCLSELAHQGLLERSYASFRVTDYGDLNRELVRRQQD